MIVTINGKQVAFEKPLNITQLLQAQQVEMQEYVTVQLDEQIIQRSDYDSAYIKEGSVVEFLYYMGGGMQAC